MKEITIYLIAVILLIISLALFIASPRKVYIPTNKRLHSCEEKGGKYGIFWSELNDEYIEYCDIIESEIKDF